MIPGWAIKFIGWGSIILFILIATIKHPADASGVFSVAGTAISAITIIYGVFAKWVWKWSVLEPLHKNPNISGGWEGTYKSSGNDNTGNQPVQGKVTLEIRQPHLGLTKIISHNEKGDAHSLAESFSISEDGRVMLTYTYLHESKPEFRQTSPMNYGATRLKLSGSSPRTLQGTYWTDRHTVGTLELTEVKN